MATQKQHDSKERKRKEFLEILSIPWAPLIDHAQTKRSLEPFCTTQRLISILYKLRIEKYLEQTVSKLLLGYIWTA